MPDDFISINNVLMYSDSSIVVTQTGDFQLQHYDRKIQSVVGYNYFEDAGFLTKIDNFNLTMQLYKSVSSSNNQYAVIAYHYFKTIDIISLSDMSLYRRICFRDYDCNEYTIDDRGNITFDDDNVTNFFTYITASKDKFYALCWDCTGEEASTGKVRSCIYEIDYSGTIIKKYQPNVTITSFAINGKEIYAIVLDHKQHEKIMYKGVLD